MNINSIQQKKINDITYIGIVYAAEWYGKDIKHARYILPLDYIVCGWSDFHDGEKSNVEGRITIAICRELKDAKLIYNSKKLIEI
jgi:hypothetical protein